MNKKSKKTPKTSVRKKSVPNTKRAPGIGSKIRRGFGYANR